MLFIAGMEQISYQTIKNRSEGLFKDRGSKFRSFAFPVSNKEQIKNILNDIREKHQDASHHCYAWRIGVNKDHFRANDDGEPTGTAGKPILRQIHKYGLTNILIVVVRYFGGTLLGTGGLINAYRSAAADVLAQSIIITEPVKEQYEISFPYAVMNNVMKVLKEKQAVMIEQDFDENCCIKVSIQLKWSESFKSRLNGIQQVSVSKLSINY